MIHVPRIAGLLALVLVAAAPPPASDTRAARSTEAKPAKGGQPDAQPPVDPKPAEPAPADTKVGDAKLFQTTREVINRGSDIYNSGDPAGCYRLFEGALLTMKPMLEHRPELQKAIVKGLASAERDPHTWRRAFTLRSVLDKLRGDLNPNRVPDKEKIGPPRVEEKTEDDKGARKDN